MSSDADRRFLAFAPLVICAAVIGLAGSWSQVAPTPSLAFVVIAFFALLSEWLAVALPVNNISLSYPLSIAAVALLGPTQAAILAVLSQVPSLFGSRRIAPLKVAFNASQLALSALAAGWCYLATGGRLLSVGPLQAADFPAMLTPIVVVSAVGILVNFTLTGTAVNLLQGTSLRRIWPPSLLAVAPTQFALGLVGVTMAQVVAALGVEQDAVGILGLLLFVIPLFVARNTYHRYAQVQDAYAGTVRSLVAAIETKDTYTKGHSVRVAQYCVAIARQMGLNDQAVQRLEYAALLHDLGKVGIAQSLLSKRGTLTPAEREAIQQHPDIGAHIIDSVPYLEDLVPVVRHHHERFDGSGYGHGLVGEDIPLAARIMSVADAYDAMTSQRPYRGALDPAVALAEVRAGSGTQFDGLVVAAFNELVEQGEVPLGDVVSREPAMSRA